MAVTQPVNKPGFDQPPQLLLPHLDLISGLRQMVSGRYLITDLIPLAGHLNPDSAASLTGKCFLFDVGHPPHRSYFFTSELNDPGSSFDVFLGALGPSVARPRHSDKHPNLGNCGRFFRDLSVEINVSGKTHRANRGELVEGGS